MKSSQQKTKERKDTDILAVLRWLWLTRAWLSGGSILGYFRWVFSI